MLKIIGGWWHPPNRVSPCRSTIYGGFVFVVDGIVDGFLPCRFYTEEKPGQTYSF
jgi:hypothetical protein